MVTFYNNDGEEIDKQEFDRINAEIKEQEDSLSVEELLMSILITSMRLYDVNMALLNLKDEKVATRLHNKHAEGGIVGSMPTLKVDE